MKRESSKETIEILGDLKEATIDIIGLVAFGHYIGIQEGTNKEFLEAIESCANLVEKRFYTPWLSSDWLYNKTQDGKKW